MTKTRVLWIDAICINQQDAVEKGHQVGMMREIYTRCLRVVVWLGNEEDASIALNFMMFSQGETVDDFVSDKVPDAVWEACHALMARSWWHRTWILQEGIHPGDVLVYIGQSTIDLDNLTKCLMWFLLLKVAFSKSRELKTVSQSTRPWAAIPIMLSKIKIWRKPSGPSTLHTENYINDFAEGLDLSATALKSEPPFLINILRQMWQRDHDQTNISFYSMLESTQMQLATDPRDNIYALLGMIIKRERAELNIPINYSCSLERCFTKATQSLLRISLNVLLLVNTSGYDSQNGKLPSWVSEFIRERDFASIWISTNWHCFSAAPGGGPCHISFHWQGNTDCIELKEIHVATVTATCLTTFKALSTENPPCYAKLFQYQYN